MDKEPLNYPITYAQEKIAYPFPNVNGYKFKFKEWVSNCILYFELDITTVSKMNAAARAQLTFQMLTLHKRQLYCQSQCSKTWGR